MADELRFDGRVAVVTGAGNGLGRSHALLLARRGCKVVVNDLGGSAHGAGASTSAADAVVAEIRAAGGEAVASHDSVENGDRIVATALDAFKRIDIVINNAGILRDTSFQKMSQEDWDLIYRVHVLGAFRVTHAAWNHLRDQGYGRIVFTASAAGIYGNFGQANYSMAKLGLVGLASTLAIEGRKKGVLVNTIAPIAGSRMTETVLPKELIDALKPEYVSPLVAYLCSESCDETGGLFEVGGGFVSKLRWERTRGKTFGLGREVTPEAVARAWPAVTGFENATHPSDIQGSMEPVLSNLHSKSRGGNEFIDADEALGYAYPPVQSHYDERDLALYALGVGAAADPTDPKDLQYVYELNPDGFRALPTYGVIPAINAMLSLAKEGRQAPGLNYGFERILHGEQYTELKRPLPPHAKLTHHLRVKDLFDKGRHALVVVSASSTDETGAEIAYNEFTTFVRGAGGWGGERGPSQDVNTPPDRAPDATVTETISASQALLYRLSGDWNPLHADPAFAKNFGFPKPILHGLCTFGYAGRQVIARFAPDGDPRYFKSIRTRFADSVFPGETLVTEMWSESPTRVIFRCRVKERDKVAISNAAIEFHAQLPTDRPASIATESAGAGVPPTAGTTLGSAEVFALIGDYIAKHPELVAQTQTVFQFKLTSPPGEWAMDLKNGTGSVKQGRADKPDCMLELTDADFMAMTSGKADPQKLYFAGKLKIGGNVMASQKLMFLKKIDPGDARAALAQRSAEAPAPALASEPAVAVAPRVFAAVAERVAKQPGLVGEVGAVVQWKVTSPPSDWVLDLAHAGGSVKQGVDPDAALTLTLSDEALGELAATATLRELYQQGKVRADGDVRLAQRLQFIKDLG